MAEEEDPLDGNYVAPTKPMTDEELSDIEHSRVGCRCSRLLAEVKRLRDLDAERRNDLYDESMD